MKIFFTILLGILIIGFCISVCIISSECDKWEQECRKEKDKTKQ